MSFRFVVIGAAISAKLLPHTYFIQKYRQFRATYGFDERELPVPKKVQQRFKEVMNDLKLSEAEKNNIELFSVHDINTFHAGTTLMNCHAIIGIPPNFKYENADNLTVDDVQIQNKYIPWTEETSKQFLQSLVFSENAQKFAIAQEILKVRRPEFWFLPLNLSMDLILAFTLYDIFYSVLKLAKKPKIVNHAFKVIVVLVSILIWLITEQLINDNVNQEITEQLAALGPKYVQGGKEFYEKLCQRESVLNYFLGKTGFNVLKDSWIIRTELPFSEQKEFFALKLQELEAA